MPNTAKHLFNLNVLASRCGALDPVVTSQERAIVERWARNANDPRFRQETERSTQAQFLVDVFGGLLGYTLPAGNLDAHNIKMETASREVGGGRTPDARLGFYGPDRDFTRVVVELKAPGANLDARQRSYGNITAVDQAFGYLGRFDDCRWAIVSNFIVIRLYFFERGLDLLQPDGRLGFITSGSFNNANFAAPFRKWLPTVGRFTHVVNFGENQPFADAEMVYPTISIVRKMQPTMRSEASLPPVSQSGAIPRPNTPESTIPRQGCLGPHPALSARLFRYLFMSGKIPESIPEAVASEGIDCDDTVFGQAEWRFQPAPSPRCSTG